MAFSQFSRINYLPYEGYSRNVGSSWSWSYGSWIYNYLKQSVYNLSPLTLWGFNTRSWRGVLDTTLCDKVCQWLVVGRWFSQNTPVSSTNKTNSPNLTEMLLKVSLNFITLTQNKKRVVHPKLDIYVLVIRALFVLLYISHNQWPSL
jgi:hypothetical protein